MRGKNHVIGDNDLTDEGIRTMLKMIDEQEVPQGNRYLAVDADQIQEVRDFLGDESMSGVKIIANNYIPEGEVWEIPGLNAVAMHGYTFRAVGEMVRDAGR